MFVYAQTVSRRTTRLWQQWLPLRRETVSGEQGGQEDLLFIYYSFEHLEFCTACMYYLPQKNLFFLKVDLLLGASTISWGGVMLFHISTLFIPFAWNRLSPSFLQFTPALGKLVAASLPFWIWFHFSRAAMPPGPHACLQHSTWSTWL